MIESISIGERDFSFIRNVIIIIKKAQKCDLERDYIYLIYTKLIIIRIILRICCIYKMVYSDGLDLSYQYD